jgi:hypothetical protein
MGIFTKRAVKGGEELTFNYNVDRYGSVFLFPFPPFFFLRANSKKKERY